MKKLQRIYHIDDDEDDRYFFEMAINEYDSSIRVTGEEDVESALKDLLSDSVEIPDLIVVDWNMPKYGAIEFIAGLRRSRKYNEVPIVILTTSSDPVDRALAEINGAYFQTKPANVKELKAKIEEFIAIAFLPFH